MIKLMVLIFFVALTTTVAHSIMYDTKIENMDKLVDRGIAPEEACERVFK